MNTPVYECHVCEVIYSNKDGSKNCPKCGVEGCHCHSHIEYTRGKITPCDKVINIKDNVCANCCLWWHNNNNKTGCTTDREEKCGAFLHIHKSYRR